MRSSIAFVCAALLVAWSVVAHAQTTVPPIPTVEGPITGPGPMHPGVREGPPGTNLQDFGYLTEEYFISGTADGTPYKTRILVRKPSRAHKFSGFVVAEPTHRGGNALICQFARFGIGKRGHACVTVAARAINLHNTTTAGAGLQDFNPERYASLTVTDTQTNEIIAQVGRLIRSNLKRSGPLGGYHVKHVILSGTSDSSAATRLYMTPHHANFRMPDGGPIYEGFFLTSTLGTAPVAMTDVPIIQMPSQSEVHVTNAYRRPDSDEPGNQFRIYEVAGMSHNDARENPAFTGCTFPLSHFPHGAFTFMGLQHLLDWAGRGKIPPRAPYIEVDNETSDGTRVALDEFGNAQGGVRSTYLDVPIFKFTIPNSGPGLCSQTGYITPLPDDVLKSLYRNKLDYLVKVVARLADLVRDGWFPKEYVKEYIIADALAADIPNRREWGEEGDH
jgi:Alpha/beta hydrolase domain